MNGIFANYLWTMFWGSVFWIFWIMWFFPRKYKYRCIRVYIRFKDDKHVIWMWIWLIQKNISLLDRIWSLWLVRFAHSPPNFISWLGRLIFSVSINSHPDNIYILITSIFFSQDKDYQVHIRWAGILFKGLMWIYTNFNTALWLFCCVLTFFFNERFSDVTLYRALQMTNS